MRALQLFWSQEEFFCPAFTRLNVHLETLKMSRNSPQHVLDIIFLWFDRFFFSPGRLLIDLISEGAKNRPLPLNTRQSQAVSGSPYFPPAVPSITPTQRHFVLSPVSLATRDQDGGPSNSTIDIYDLTEIGNNITPKKSSEKHL